MCWSHRCLCKVSEQPLSIVFVSVLVWEPWFLEQRFGSHSKWWQRQWWDRTRNPRGGSHFRRMRGPFNTQNTKALISGVLMTLLFWKSTLLSHNSKKTLKKILSFLSFFFFFYSWRVEVLDICKLLNFLGTFGCQFEKKKEKLQLKVWLSRCHPPVILLSMLNQCRLFFFLTHGGGIEHGDVCGMVTRNSRVKAAWKNPFSV